MEKFNKRAIILGTLAVVLGLGLSGCGKKPASVVNSDVNQNQNVNANTNVVTTIDEIDTSDWKIYRNEEYGFEFKYPNSWKINNLNDGRISLLPSSKELGYEYVGDIILKVYFNYNNKSIKDYYKINNLRFLEDTIPSEINIGSYKTLYFKDVPGMVSSDTYVFTANNLIFEFTIFNQQINLKKIIESVKLLRQ